MLTLHNINPVVKLNRPPRLAQFREAFTPYEIFSQLLVQFDDKHICAPACPSNFK